ncbi:MAG: BadM/Rrf2 family transcriptional regulator [uncultured bacterium]|nr:MAG: BadM/Rrf2 family transcriptional regulator [uncultured bacterium]
MQISYKTDYSLKIILYLSGCYPDGTAHIKQIADAQDIPKKFLEQILLLLKKGGFVASKQGPRGGYFLTKDPAEIAVGDVIRFVEGPIHPISCIAPGAEESCSFASTCVFRDIWLDVETAIANVIDTISFSDLLEREKKKRGQVAIDFQI